MNRTRRVVIEAVTAGAIQSRLEYYDPTQPNTVQETPNIQHNLSFLAAPYSFTLRIYHMSGLGFGYELLDELGTLVDTPQLTGFIESPNNPPINGEKLFIMGHSRTGLDLPSISSIGWGYVVPNRLSVPLSNPVLSNGGYITYGALSAGVTEFVTADFLYSAILSDNAEYIPDHILITSTPFSMPAIVYATGFKNISKAVQVGGTTNPAKVRYPFNSALSVLLPPGVSVRYTIVYRNTAESKKAVVG